MLWNDEETGLNGAYAYVEQRASLQGIESPKGSGRYPELRWLGMVQHDMELFDHGMPRPDGTLSPTQRPEADINIEFQSRVKQADYAGPALQTRCCWYSATEMIWRVRVSQRMQRNAPRTSRNFRRVTFPNRC